MIEGKEKQSRWNYGKIYLDDVRYTPENGNNGGVCILFLIDNSKLKTQIRHTLLGVPIQMPARYFY